KKRECDAIDASAEASCPAIDRGRAANGEALGAIGGVNPCVSHYVRSRATARPPPLAVRRRHTQAIFNPPPSAPTTAVRLPFSTPGTRGE
uniref:Uncharacterized protein n=1 Tax=Aegilops tauschii subsp. strangulata TaxID=200361 RepID=A0A453SYR8_AEGTS